MFAFLLTLFLLQAPAPAPSPAPSAPGPIIVETVRQPSVTREITMGDVVLGAVGVVASEGGGLQREKRIHYRDNAPEISIGATESEDCGSPGIGLKKDLVGPSDLSIS